MGDYMAIPWEIVKANAAVTLAADVFFVDGTAFLMTVSRKIKFVTVEHLPVRAAKCLCKHLKRVLLMYEWASFRVRTILMDGEFERINNLMATVECNTTAAMEHLSKVERTIWMIKERTRRLITTLPFHYIPRRMKIEFICFIVLWLNAFPVTTGVSATYSPWELLVRWQLDYKKHCRVLPGTYCKVHYKPVPSNTMMARTHEAIALGPTGNLQGSVKLYCLTMGRVLKRQLFMAIPMLSCIIKCVDTIGLHEKQGWEFCFVNRNKEPYEWMDKILENDPNFQEVLEEEEEVAIYPDITAELPGVMLEDEMDDTMAVVEGNKPNFQDLAAIALDNVWIDPQEQLRAAQTTAAAPIPLPAGGSAILDAEEDKIIYELTFNLPDAGLAQSDRLVVVPLNNNEVAPAPTVVAEEERRYLTQSHRCAVGRQPYDKYLAPRMTFLQLGEARANRSVLEANWIARMLKEEQLLATTTGNVLECDMINEVDHERDPEMVTNSKDEVKVGGYMMTQYNLKVGL
jgi:hypothetical protein